MDVLFYFICIKACILLIRLVVGVAIMQGAAQLTGHVAEITFDGNGSQKRKVNLRKTTPLVNHPSKASSSQ